MRSKLNLDVETVAPLEAADICDIWRTLAVVVASAVVIFTLEWFALQWFTTAA
jgi:hypothetical protein